MTGALALMNAPAVSLTLKAVEFGIKVTESRKTWREIARLNERVDSIEATVYSLLKVIAVVAVVYVFLSLRQR